MRSSILIFETGLRTSPPLVTASELSPEIVSGGVDSSVTHGVGGGVGGVDNSVTQVTHGVGGGGVSSSMSRSMNSFKGNDSLGSSGSRRNSVDAFNAERAANELTSTVDELEKRSIEAAWVSKYKAKRASIAYMESTVVIVIVIFMT